MAINPDDITTARVGQLPPASFNLTDLIPHEVGTVLSQGTIQSFADFLAAYIDTTGAVAFRPVTVLDGQTLPDTTELEWILVGKGTFINVNGGANITTTEELNALMSNGTYWFIGVEIPIEVEGIGYTPESIANKISEITTYSEILYPNEKAVHDLADTKLNITDLPSNLTLYPTTTASAIGGYFKMVTSPDDPDYDATAVDVSTGAITTTAQLISSLVAPAGTIIGQPGIINITTIGNIRRVSGSGTADFYFELYHRNLAGTETFIGVSNPTMPITNSVYGQFSTTAVWNDGTFLDTDTIVIKYYANRIAGGVNPVYEFQFGGLTPVRSIVPVSFNVLAGDYELKENKQNSLAADGTGVKYPTVDAVNDLDTNLVHKTGTEIITGDKTFEGLFSLEFEDTQFANNRPVAWSLVADASPSSNVTQFTDYHGIDLVHQTTSPNMNSDAAIFGLETAAWNRSNSNMRRLVPFYSLADNNGTGTVGDLTGVQIMLRNSSTGTVTNMYGILIKTPTNTGTIGNEVVGVNIEAISTASTVNRGLKIDNITGAATNYSIFTGSGLVRFNDKVGINRVPTVPLDVSGNGSFTGTNALINIQDGARGYGNGVTTTAGYSGTFTNHDYDLRVGGTVRMKIFNTSYNVCIRKSGTFVDDGVNILQVVGTISASPATLSNQVVVKSQLSTQIEIGANSNVLDAWMDNEVIFTASCTITVPATLPTNFNFNWLTLAGVTVTWAITSPHTWLFGTPGNATEKTYGRMVKRNSTNSIIML